MAAQGSGSENLPSTLQWVGLQEVGLELLAVAGGGLELELELEGELEGELEEELEEGGTPFASCIASQSC